MESGKPGIWIGAAILLAVLIVAVSVPRNRENAPAPVAPASGEPNQPAASSPGGTSIPPVPSAGSSQSSPPVAADGTSAPLRSAPVPAMIAAETPPAQLAPISPDVSRDTAREALDNVQFALRDYRTALGGNPFGTNTEITNALFGDNAKQVRQPMPDGSRINGSGELCDPWGTPYFFHQQSATKMEVRSAGPDLKMWTGDDIQM